MQNGGFPARDPKRAAKTAEFSFRAADGADRLPSQVGGALAHAGAATLGLGSARLSAASPRCRRRPDLDYFKVLFARLCFQSGTLCKPMLPTCPCPGKPSHWKPRPASANLWFKSCKSMGKVTQLHLQHECPPVAAHCFRNGIRQPVVGKPIAVPKGSRPQRTKRSGVHFPGSQAFSHLAQTLVK